MALYTADNGNTRLIRALYTAQGGTVKQIRALYTARNGAEYLVYEPGRMLWDYAVGETFYLTENGVPALYRVWQKDYLGNGNVLAVREYALSEPMAFDPYGEQQFYENSDVDTFLCGTFTARLAQGTADALRTVSLPVIGNYGGAVGTILRSVFLLSDGDLGGTLESSPSLAWYTQNAAVLGANAARLCCCSSGGEAVRWHLRTPDLPPLEDGSYTRQVRTDGSFMGTRVDYPAYIRPALVLDELYIPEQ